MAEKMFATKIEFVNFGAGHNWAVYLESQAYRDGNVYADSAREHWQQAGTFRIERREPEWTGRGKFPPLVVHRV